MKKTVFISSTYEDLVDHRRAAWQVLKGFNVNVSGMEEFGARTSAPIETCLAAVEQSDIYVGLLGFRWGSLNKETGKSFTQMEYEHALHLKKETLIYLIEEKEARVRLQDIDLDLEPREKLKAFKANLQNKHLVNWFSTPEDLAEKLKTDFARHLDPNVGEPGQLPKDEFEATIRTIRHFQLMPKTVLGREILVRASFTSAPYPASRSLCNAFNLEYGRTVGIEIFVEKPNMGKNESLPFREVYAAGPKARRLLEVVSNTQDNTAANIYATVQFAEVDVPSVRAEFFGRFEDNFGEPDEYPGDHTYIPPEGKSILVFSKPAL